MAQVYEFEGFRLDPEARRLTYRDRPIRLTAKAISVLALLAERAPAVVSRADFEAAIWPEGFVEPANLTQTIYMLRRALERVAPQPIETVNGRGYRLAAPVSCFAATARRRRRWNLVASIAIAAAVILIAVGLTAAVRFPAHTLVWLAPH